MANGRSLPARGVNKLQTTGGHSGARVHRISLAFVIHDRGTEPAKLRLPMAHTRWLVTLLALSVASAALARDAKDPIRLAYVEGDLAGYTNVFAKDGTEPIGYVEYIQHRKGDTLEARRVAWFNDGSSDEDVTVARVGKTLRLVRGQSIIRDAP